MPHRALKNPSELGGMLGAFVGTLDVTTTVAGEKFLALMTRAGTASDMPRGVVKRGVAEAVVRDASWATGVNVAKNIARALLPFMLPKNKSGLISRTSADLLDVSWDGGAGLVTGLVNAARKMDGGGAGVPYLARLMLQPPEKFAKVVNRSLSPEHPVEAAPQEGQAANRRLPNRIASQLVVPLSVLGIIMVHISMLVSRNANIIDAGHKGRDIDTSKLVDPHVMASKGLSSTHQMGLMTATIGLMAPVIDMAADKLVEYAMNPSLPKFRWPAFLRSSLSPAPRETGMNP